MSKTIMVAVALLSGGVLANGTLQAFEVKPGEEVTEAKAKKLGLNEAGVKAAIELGQIAEVEARVAESGDSAGDGEALADAVTRAEKAEGQVKALTDKVVALEKDLAEATKPKTGAA